VLPVELVAPVEPIAPAETIAPSETIAQEVAPVPESASQPVDLVLPAGSSPGSNPVAKTGTAPDASGPTAPEQADAAIAEPEPERCAQCDALLAASDIFCGECGFVRRGIGSHARPRDTVAFDPFPWGSRKLAEPAPESGHGDADLDAAAKPPAPASEVAPAPVVPDATVPDLPVEVQLVAADSAAAPAVPSAFADEPDMDETRIVDRDVRGERFVLQFSTGESISVAGTGLVGRHPLAEPGEYFDALVVITDPGKSVSKTHLEFGQDGGAFWVSDRFSGNGTIVREPESQPRRCDSGKRYRIRRGTRVDIGEQFFIVS
jgi:hypothetical protein